MNRFYYFDKEVKMDRLILVIAFLMIQSSAWAKLDGCSGKYSFLSPTSGKIIKCGSASQCAKKHARASSYWQRIGGDKEKFIVTYRGVTLANGYSIEYKSITKQYLNSDLISKITTGDSFDVYCKNNG